MLGRICSHGCSPSQIVHGWCDVLVKSVVFFEGGTNRNCQCALIVHTCVCATPVILEILYMLVLGLRCTAAGALPSAWYSSHSALAHGTVSVFLRILFMVLNALQCG
jgi:hypothetical protein